jgi:hypothetical protein
MYVHMYVIKPDRSLFVETDFFPFVITESKLRATNNNNYCRAHVPTYPFIESFSADRRFTQGDQIGWLFTSADLNIN